ncbi:hypothetical protein R1sor_008240 [Riccia sorocarpa]|uniref:Uncharacterized protein n=1 Tax=Riccia sorocarpa TaxID=122646 RepID=A0ABD3HW87_9MARC
MGNAVTCSLVDVVGTVTVTQTDGPILEFMQPVFAFQVRKLHPGNWLVHYMSVHDPQLGGQHSKMSVLNGNEELQPGEIYFLLPVPSSFRKQLFGSKRQSSKGHHHSSSRDSPISQRLQMQLQPLYDMIEGTEQSKSVAEELSMSSLPATMMSTSPPQEEWREKEQEEQNQQFKSAESLLSIPQSRPTKKCSRQRFHVYDWRPTLVTIPEIDESLDSKRVQDMIVGHDRAAGSVVFLGSFVVVIKATFQ